MPKVSARLTILRFAVLHKLLILDSLAFLFFYVCSLARLLKSFVFDSNTVKLLCCVMSQCLDVIKLVLVGRKYMSCYMLHILNVVSSNSKSQDITSILYYQSSSFCIVIMRLYSQLHNSLMCLSVSEFSFDICLKR